MEDPAFAPSILEPLEVIGVDAFKAGEVTLRFRIKTLPLKQWEVGRELRRRIKKAFDASGIKIPAPQMTVTLKKLIELVPNALNSELEPTGFTSAIRLPHVCHTSAFARS